MSLGSSGAVNSKLAQTPSGRGGGLAKWLRHLIPTRDEARRHRALRWLGPLLEREWLWHLNRRTVASGAALGVFFGLIIPVGQIPLAAAGAVLLRANLPAAALGTLVSNPFTVGPIYWLAYRTGLAVLDPAGSNGDLSGVTAAIGSGQSGPPLDWLDHIANAGEPLMLGLALFAAGGALVTYLAVRLAWRLNVQWQRRRHRATDEWNPSHN
jgi:uncharacterized protein (DUF2062 family)